jgi:hypothetical protein
MKIGLALMALALATLACNLRPRSAVPPTLTPSPPPAFNTPAPIASITPLPAGAVGVPVAQAPGPGGQVVQQPASGQVVAQPPSGQVVVPPPGSIGAQSAPAGSGQVVQPGTGVVVATPIPGITINTRTVQGVEQFAVWSWQNVLIPAYNTTVGLATSLWQQAGAQAGFMGQFFFCIVPIAMILLFVRGYRGRR